MRRTTVGEPGAADFVRGPTVRPCHFDAGFRGSEPAEWAVPGGDRP